MELELRFFANFRSAVGQKTVYREFPDGSTVGDVLRGIEDEWPELAGDILEDGDIRPQLSVLKNGREVVHLQGTATPIEDGDSLAVFPPVAGGATVEKKFRGISKRLARSYLENLGGTTQDDDTVVADDWHATLSAQKVAVGETTSIRLTEVTVTFEGENLEEIVKEFSRKAMRAGG